jgi:hypothetical protein
MRCAHQILDVQQVQQIDQIVGVLNAETVENLSIHSRWPINGQS